MAEDWAEKAKQQAKEENDKAKEVIAEIDEQVRAKPKKQ